MSRFIAITASLVALFLLAPAPIRAEEKPSTIKDALQFQDALQNAIQEAEPAIACILVSRSETYRKLQPPTTDTPGHLGSYDRKKAEKDFFGSDDRKKELKRLDLADPDNVPESYGSGVVVDEKGLILTNYHVVRDATKIYVRLPGGRGSYADIHAADYRSDLAVLRLLDVKTPLKAIKLGDGGKVRKGQLVLSIANPFAAGFRDGSPSASWGIVSNLRQKYPGPTKEEDRSKPTPILHQYGTLIQTDARLNLGCSGGALIDLKGEMVGLTSAIAALSGVETAGGFAIPIDAGMRRIVDVLKRGEEVEYGFLGVAPDERPRVDGVELLHVTAGSPAERAGLRRSEIVVSVNGTPVKKQEELFLALGTCLAGTPVDLEVRPFIGAAPRPVKVTLAKYYVSGKSIVSNMPAPVRGLRVDYTSLLPQIAKFPPIPIPSGVLIREIIPNSPAEKAQLRQYEVITQVNGRSVSTPAEFYREAGKVTGPLELTLSVETGQPLRKVKVN